MNWLICWISRRAQEPPAPMISSISLRSPRKTSGLFDTGFAGGALDATSLDLNAPADWIDDPFSLGGLNSVDFIPQPGPSTGLSGSFVQGEKQQYVQPNVMDNFDLLDPLADLETDQLADNSLDAFVNLDDFLMGDAFFDEQSDMKPDFTSLFDDAVEVKPVISIPTVTMKPEEVDLTTALTGADIDFLLPEEPILSSTKSRKRKATNEAVVKTSMFEIPVSENIVTTTSPSADPQLDHDYTTKRQKMSATPGSMQKCNTTTTNGKGNSKERPAKAKISLCEASTSSKSLDSSTEDFTTDKMAVRRMKNNVASKRSREQRKQKFADLDQEAEDLIIANEGLKKKIVELERVAKEMKALLVAKMAGK